MPALADMVPYDLLEDLRRRNLSDVRPVRTPTIPDTIAPDPGTPERDGVDEPTTAALLYVILMFFAGYTMLRGSRRPPNPPASPLCDAHAI